MELANRFASFFYQKIENIRPHLRARTRDMPVPAEPEFKLPDTTVMLSLRPTAAAELTRLLRKSNNKTCGLDPCPTGLLKESRDSHLPAILGIFNGSLKHGVFPEVFKQADVTPILKKPNLDEQQLSNYRPVSNRPYLGKLLERLVAERLCSHIEQHDLGERFQSAYKAHHSTETALMRVQNDIASALDSNRAMMLVMVDLSAEFDTVDHTQFVTLLQAKYGVRGMALEWFRSYLTGRHFRVKVGDCRSDPHSLRCRVPQGSVLGPIIFTICTPHRWKTSYVDMARLTTSTQMTCRSMEIAILYQTPIASAYNSWRNVWLKSGPGCCPICLNKRPQNRTDSVHESPAGQASTERADNQYARWLSHHHHRGCEQPRIHHGQLPGLQRPGLHHCEGL